MVLSKDKLRKIVKESFRKVLNESQITNKSYSLNKILPIIKNNGGKWIDLYYKDYNKPDKFTFFVDDNIDSKSFENIKSALNIGGYTISSMGGYYEDKRLRVDLENAVDNDLFDSVYNVCVINIEPMYSDEANEEFINNDN